jgi:hypothetical protein
MNKDGGYAENRVLRRILSPKREEGTGKWNKTHNGEPRNLYSSPNFIKMIKFRRIRSAGHIVCMREMINAHNILHSNTG